MTRHHARFTSNFGPTLAAALAFAALALPAPAGAGNRQWTQLGPDGGSIYALAVDPLDLDVVYAATSTTVFRSADGGASWSFAGAGLGGLGPGIRTITKVGSSLLVGSTWDGIWTSRDDARSWQRTGSGLPDRPHIEAFVLDPNHHERLWATAWEGLFFSDDRGNSWTARGGELAPGGVRALAIDSFTGQLYARTVSEVFTSTDDGESWSLLRCLGRRCGDVVVDPQQAGTLLTVSGSILRSRDAGATWQKLRGPKGSFVLLGFQGGRLFGIARNVVRGVSTERLHFSDDQGDHWMAAAETPAEPSLGPLLGAGDTLYLGSSGATGAGGVFRSRDGGEHWEAASAGLSPRWIESLVVHPTQPGVIVAKASDHLFVSEDDGASWRVSLPAAGVQTFGAGDLLIDADVPARIWSADGVYLLRSDDLGRRWVQVSRVGTGVATVEADPRTPAGIWVGTSTAVYNSPDGRTWKRLRLSTAESFGVLDIAAHPGDPQVVWVAGYGYTPGSGNTGARLYRSDDGGRSWQRRDDGLPGWGVYVVVLDPLRTDVLFAASGDGIFRSRDGGASWQRLPSPAPVSGDPEAIRWEIVASPETPAALYATLAGSEAIFRSRDEGDTWQRVGANTGEAGAGSIPALVVDPHDTRRLLIGTAKRGILTWTDAAP
jgi:photosystem II stability/assembly factor-like uncharacterized protein